MSGSSGIFKCVVFSIWYLAASPGFGIWYLVLGCKLAAALAFQNCPGKIKAKNLPRRHGDTGFGIWYLVLGCKPGIRYLVLGTWYLVLGLWYLVFGSWYLAAISLLC